MPSRLTIPALAAAVLVALSAAPASANIRNVVEDGKLVVQSDSEGDRILISTLGSATSLTVIDESTGGPRTTFTRSGFDRIEVTGGAGGDRITIDSSGGVFTDTERTTIDAGSGDDRVVDGDGPTRIVGGSGTDGISAGGGDDAIVHDLAAAFDSVDAGAGSDTWRLVGSDGPEEVLAGTRDATTFVSIGNVSGVGALLEGSENISFDGGLGDDRLVAGPGVTVQADGGQGKDFLVSASGLDKLSGGPGPDELGGGAEADEIDGGEGDDVLFGDRGADALRGGAGTDEFRCDPTDSLLDLEPLDTLDGCTAPPALPAPPAQPPATVQPPAATPGSSPEQPARRAGLARPRIKFTRTGLKVVVRSASAQPIRAVVAAREPGRRYRRVRRTIAAGARVTIALKGRSVGRARGRRRAVVTVTDRATGTKVTAKKRR